MEHYVGGCVVLGFFEGSKKMAQRAMNSASKDDVVAERIFDFFFQ